MSTPNVERLRGTLAHVEAHPDEHDQAMYAIRTPCGTSYCFAGHGVRMYAPDAEFQWGELAMGGDEGFYGANRVKMCGADGELKFPSVSFVARELFGLTERQALRLFDEDNSLEDLRELVDEFCGGTP